MAMLVFNSYEGLVIGPKMTNIEIFFGWGRLPLLLLLLAESSSFEIRNKRLLLLLWLLWLLLRLIDGSESLIA